MLQFLRNSHRKNGKWSQILLMVTVKAIFEILLSFRVVNEKLKKFENGENRYGFFFSIIFLNIFRINLN